MSNDIARCTGTFDGNQCKLRDFCRRHLLSLDDKGIHPYLLHEMEIGGVTVRIDISDGCSEYIPDDWADNYED